MRTPSLDPQDAASPHVGHHVRRRLRAFAAAAAAIAVLLPATDAAARMIGRYFSIDLPTIRSETTYEKKNEERVTIVSNNKEDTNTLSSEFDIRTRGWVYHPALSVFSLSLRPRIKRQNTSATGNFERDDQIIFFGFTFDSTFLQYKPYTFKLFSSRDRNEFDSTLSPDSITRTAIDRGTLLLKYDPLPTTVTIERDTTDFSGFNQFRDTTYLARTETRHETEQSRSFIKTEFVRQRREFETSSFTVNRAQLNANNFYKFGVDDHLFSSFLANRTTSEVSSITTFRLGENLALRHTPNLRSDYQFRFDSQDEDVFFTRRVYGSARLRHQLYENLTTTLGTQAQYQTFTGGNDRTYDANLDFQYQRRIPGGRVGLSNGYSIRLEDNNAKAQLRDVRDESHVLTGTSLAFLENQDVDLASIVVTDSTGLIFFTENVDYVVTVVGDSVAISRTGVGSAIVDGSTVLVDYRFTSRGPFNLYNTGIHFGATLSLWEMIRLSYNLSKSKDHLISGIPPSTLTDDTIHEAEAELRWRFSTTHVEYENRNESRTPLSRWRAQETLSFRPLRRFTASVSASYGRTRLKDTNDLTTEQGANVDLAWQPFRRAEFAVRGFLRRVRGDIQRTNDVGFNARFRWRFGLWSGTIKYEKRQEDDFLNDQRRDSQSILLQLVRRFEFR